MPMNAGAYDPVPATIYKLVTEVDDANSREPIQTRQAYFQTFIRWPWAARYGTEQPVQTQPKSSGEILCRMRRNQLTMTIDPSMTFIHDGQEYGIVSINPIPSMERDEIEFLVRWIKTATLVTA